MGFTFGLWDKRYQSKRRATSERVRWQIRAPKITGFFAAGGGRTAQRTTRIV